jgi:YggT family protein
MEYYSNPNGHPVVDFFLNLLSLYNIVILIRVVTSWFPVDRRAEWYRLLWNITEPVMAPCRRLVPPIGMIDVSPMVVLLLLQVAAELIRLMAH